MSSRLFFACLQSRRSPDWPCVGLWLNPSGTLVILVVEIRFSTQQEVIWDFLLLLMSRLQWQQWPHCSTVTAVMCSACSFLTTEGEKRRVIMQESWSSCCVSANILHALAGAADYLRLDCGNVDFVCHVFETDKSLCRRTDSVQMFSHRWYKNSAQVRPYSSPADINIKIKHNSRRLFFRNIFYRWCQRWNVQSVGPKESFFYQ